MESGQLRYHGLNQCIFPRTFEFLSISGKTCALRFPNLKIAIVACGSQMGLSGKKECQCDKRWLHRHYLNIRKYTKPS
jgi:hypothetical protein